MANYSNEAITRVWSMARTIEGYNPGLVRQDRCGAVIRFQDYGNRESLFGWEIDHIHPLSLGGTDTWDNVQPLHWGNNSSKGDGPLTCSVNPRTQ